LLTSHQNMRDMRGPILHAPRRQYILRFRGNQAEQRGIVRRSLLSVVAGALSVVAGAAILVAGLAPAQAAAEAVVTGGSLIYLEAQAHTNLYPPAGGFYPNGGILNQLADRLTYQDPKTLQIEPWIAESWQINPAKTEYTFRIRKGVTFSDGTPLDATAVARNYDTYGLGNANLRQPVSEVLNNYDRSEVVDPYTIRFVFKKPSPGFLQGTSVIGSALVSPGTLAHKFDELGKATAIIGSGPFVAAQEILGKQLILTARKDYNWGPPGFAHQGRAYIDQIKWIVAPEDSVRIGSLLAGQADLVRQVQAYDEQQVLGQGYLIYAPPTRGVNNSIVFRPDNALVSDRRVREALLHATDSQEIVQTLYSANYPRATSILASTASGYIDLSSKLTFDLDRAKALLEAAGWKIGADGLRQKEGSELVLSIYPSLPQPQNKAMLQLIAQQWAKVGVRLNVLAADVGSRVLDDLDPLKTPVAPAMVGRADPDVLKSEYYPLNRDSMRQKGGASTKVRSFVDEKLNELLVDIASEGDEKKRLALVGEVQTYVIDQAYAIPIFEEPQAFAAAPYVKQLAFEAVGRPSFYNLWIARH
jgi:peptide/nickel transport system substrate-binding protein